MLRTLHLHSLRFAISSETLDVGPFLDALYVDNVLPDGVLAAAPRTTLAVHLELGDPSSTPSLADRPDAVFAENNLCGAPAYFAGGRFAARLHGDYPLVLDYEPAAARVDAVLGGAFATDPLAVVGRVIRPLLQSFALPFHGLKSLHGALVARDGRGVFLAGPGGAGKTTTALAFARHGWTVLSDDGPLFALDDRGGAVGLSSLDYLHVSDATLALFPELRHRVVGGPDHRDKYAVGHNGCGRNRDLGDPVVVDTYVVLRRTPIGRPRLVPLPRSDVFRAMVGEEMTVFRPAGFRDSTFGAYSRWCLRVLASLSERAEPVLVEYGDDHLDRIPSLVESRW